MLTPYRFNCPKFRIMFLPCTYSKTGSKIIRIRFTMNLNLISATIYSNVSMVKKYTSMV